MANRRVTALVAVEPLDVVQSVCADLLSWAVGFAFGPAARSCGGWRDWLAGWNWIATQFRAAKRSSAICVRFTGSVRGPTTPGLGAGLDLTAFESVITRGSDLAFKDRRAAG